MYDSSANSRQIGAKRYHGNNAYQPGDRVRDESVGASDSDGYQTPPSDTALGAGGGGGPAHAAAREGGESNSFQYSFEMGGAPWVADAASPSHASPATRGGGGGCGAVRIQQQQQQRLQQPQQGPSGGATNPSTTAGGRSAQLSLVTLGDGDASEMSDRRNQYFAGNSRAAAASADAAGGARHISACNSSRADDSDQEDLHRGGRLEDDEGVPGGGAVADGDFRLTASALGSANATVLLGTDARSVIDLANESTRAGANFSESYREQQSLANMAWQAVKWWEWLVALLFVLFILALAVVAGSEMQKRRVRSERDAADSIVQHLVTDLGRDFATTIGITRSFATLFFGAVNASVLPNHADPVKANRQVQFIQDKFEEYSREELRRSPSVVSFSTRPSDVLTQIYPPGTSPYGLDMVQFVPEEIAAARRTEFGYIAGPRKLFQGYWGLVTYWPIWLRTTDPKSPLAIASEYWGSVGNVVNVTRFVEGLHIGHQLSETLSSYSSALLMDNTVTGNKSWFGDAGIVDDERVRHAVSSLNGINNHVYVLPNTPVVSPAEIGVSFVVLILGLAIFVVVGRYMLLARVASTVTKNCDNAPPSGRVCLMLCRIADAALYWEQQDPDKMHRTLDVYAAIIRAVISDFAGYEVLYEGHGFVIACHGIDAAAKMSIAIHEAMADCTAWPLKLHNKTVGLMNRIVIVVGNAHAVTDPLTGTPMYQGFPLEQLRAMEPHCRSGCTMFRSDQYDQVPEEIQEWLTHCDPKPRLLQLPGEGAAEPGGGVPVSQFVMTAHLNSVVPLYAFPTSINTQDSLYSDTDETNMPAHIRQYKAAHRAGRRHVFRREEVVLASTDLKGQPYARRPPTVSSGSTDDERGHQSNNNNNNNNNENHRRHHRSTLSAAGAADAATGAGGGHHERQQRGGRQQHLRRTSSNDSAAAGGGARAAYTDSLATTTASNNSSRTSRSNQHGRESPSPPHQTPQQLPRQPPSAEQHLAGAAASADAELASNSTTAITKGSTSSNTGSGGGGGGQQQQQQQRQQRRQRHAQDEEEEAEEEEEEDVQYHQNDVSPSSEQGGTADGSVSVDEEALRRARHEWQIQEQQQFQLLAENGAEGLRRATEARREERRQQQQRRRGGDSHAGLMGQVLGGGVDGHRYAQRASHFHQDPSSSDDDARSTPYAPGAQVRAGSTEVSDGAPSRPADARMNPDIVSGGGGERK